jgi:predicted amidohydrolase YtcJ
VRRFALVVAAVVLIAAKSGHVTVYEGGPIITMSGDAPEAVDAIAVSNGKILAVGKAEAVNKIAGRKARHVDLKGHTLLPGFVDAHGHVSAVGQAAGFANLAPRPVGTVNSIAAIQQALRDYLVLRKIPVGAPVIGTGYDDSQLAEKRHPTRQELDAVSTDHPIVISHASGHFAVLNSAMLKLVDYTSDTPNPPGGVIRREADGKAPNGVVEEAALYKLGKLLPTPTHDEGVATLMAAHKIYASHGITTAQDGRVMPEAWPALAEAAKRKALIMDTVVLLSFERDWSPEVRAQIGKPYAGRIRIGGVKLTIDGSPQGRTAWLQDPVPVPPEGKGSDYRGYPAIDLGLLKSKFADAAANNWQVFVHVNGDEAMQTLIDDVAATGLAEKRTIAIHAQVTRPDQLAEMKKLDIQPSFFANHTWYWGDWHRDVALGPKRADFISPQASAWAAGLRPTAHNDSPVVPPDMMRLIWSSVNRRTQSGDILGPLERIPVYKALQQVTINAAWQIHEDTSKGSLSVGKLADLVVLDANPLAIDPTTLANVRVLATIKEGQIIFGALD